MNTPEDDIKESILRTLSFLASKDQQRKFAEKVYYDVYQDEFACWWFDTFFPEEHIFSKDKKAILSDFSKKFDRIWD